MTFTKMFEVSGFADLSLRTSVFEALPPHADAVRTTAMQEAARMVRRTLSPYVERSAFGISLAHYF
jgi:hypothetical protein